MLLLNKDNHRQKIRLKLHQEFMIELDANPTAGYKWTLNDTTTGIIRLVRSQFKETSDRIMIGASGKQQFNLKANAVGQMKLKLIYHRSWEKDVAPIDSFLVSIDVQE